MDNQTFEQVIDLKDKPSVRKSRTPEMNELYKQGLFSHLFSIEEEVSTERTLCNKKRIIISATSVVAVVSVVTILALFTTGTFQARKDETTMSRDRSRMNKTSDKDVNSNTQLTTRVVETVPTSVGTTEQAPSVCSPNITSLDDHVQGCIPSPLLACRSIHLCETFLPSRFSLARSLTDLQERYNEKMEELNVTCHPYTLRFLCAQLSPPCPKVPVQETSEPFYAFDVINFPYVHVPLPCKSLCENISETCFEDEDGRTDIYNLCSILPESTSEEICFGGALSEVPLCQSFTCENGGSCFTVNGQQYCKCQPGYYGTHCEIDSPSDYHVTQGQCVSVPYQCRPFLPFNTTRGLNLMNSSLAYVASWERISSLAYEGIEDTRVPKLFCGLFYPQCATDESRNTTILCREMCTVTKHQFEFVLASMGFPPLMCEKLVTRAPAGYTCLI